MKTLVITLEVTINNSDARHIREDGIQINDLKIDALDDTPTVVIGKQYRVTKAKYCRCRIDNLPARRSSGKQKENKRT
jgi:hypothetical protein